MSGDTGIDKHPVPQAGTGVAHHWPFTSWLEFGAYSSAIPSARGHARNVLREWGVDTLIEDADVLVAELLTNALKATRELPDVDSFALRLVGYYDRVIIEVWDQHPGVPIQRPIDQAALSGRGLLIVDALSERWGYRYVGESFKVVWCELKLH